MPDVVEVTVLENGTIDVVERDFTLDEEAQRKAAIDAVTAAQSQAAEARAAALAKLAALGLTVDDLAALGL